MTAAEKYVAAAYLVVFAVVFLYVLIIAAKLQRLEQTLQDLSSETRLDEPASEPTQPAVTSRSGKHHAVEAQIR